MSDLSLVKKLMIIFAWGTVSFLVGNNIVDASITQKGIV